MLRNPYGCDKMLRNSQILFIYFFYLSSSASLEVCTAQYNMQGSFLLTHLLENQFSFSDIQSFQMLRNEGRVIMVWVVGWKYFIKLKLLKVSVLNI